MSLGVLQDCTDVKVVCCVYRPQCTQSTPECTQQEFVGGLLDRSTARYFYKWLKTKVHKPTSILLENLFSKNCTFKNNLQLLEKKFLSQTNTTPKNGILTNKMACLLKSSIFQ
jgi:hypothetical protein